MPYSCKTLIKTDQELASREKRLSICLGADGFSFSETSTAGMLLTFGEVEGLHADTMTDVMRDIKTLFASIGIRPLGYASSELIVLTDESVWVPDELYSSANMRKYLKLMGAEPVTVMTCHSQALASTSVFAAAEHVVMAFKVTMPGVVVLNQHAKMAQLTPQSIGRMVLFTHWRKGRVDVAAFNNGRYLYGNTLAFGNSDEAIYHVVDVMKSFNLESSATEMLMCGDVDRDLFAHARPYFPRVTLFNGTAKQSANPEFQQLHTYRHALILM
ncbi:MAG: DUF3822 family protein [Bacteroidales bacterium]|nr:DUF3822 family protein [Bacteroidales bacterium]